MKKLLMSIATAGTLVVVVSSPAWSAANDGLNPEGRCNGSSTVRSAPLRSAFTGGTSGTVYLQFKGTPTTTCGTAWGRVVSSAPGCQPGNDFCGNAYAERVSPDYLFEGCAQNCQIAGKTVWWSLMVNDIGGKLARASGNVDNGPNSYVGTTGTF